MKKKTTIAILAMLVVSLMTGCGKQQVTQNENATEYYRVTIDGDKVFYDENHEDVQQISTINPAFLTAFLSQDYQNPDLESAYDYCTEELAAQGKEPASLKARLESLKANKLLLTVDYVDLNKIEFYKLKGKPSATASCRYYFTIKNATDQYLEANHLEQDVQYVRDIFVEYVGEGDDWKVSKYTRGPIEKAN